MVIRLPQTAISEARMKVVRTSVPGLGSTMDRLEIGGVTVTCIPEPGGIIWPVRALFASIGDEELRSLADAAPAGALDPDAGTMALSFNIYLVQTPDFTALIDAGVGNDKERPDRPAWHRRSAPFLDLLAGLSVRPEDVDLVVTTHLHADHVGWNTVLGDAGWTPAFPNARYVVPEAELSFWLDLAKRDGPENLLHGAFADSIQPIIDTVGYEGLPSPGEIGPGLHYHPAPGHTVGMSIVRLIVGETEIHFIADVVHHPLQMADIDIVSNFCSHPEQARGTRRRLFEEAAARQHVLAPYHFPTPVFGHVEMNDRGFRYRPLPVATE